MPDRADGRLAGLAAASGEERVALADLPLARFRDDPLLTYETDEGTRLRVVLQTNLPTGVIGVPRAKRPIHSSKHGGPQPGRRWMRYLVPEC